MTDLKEIMSGGRIIIVSKTIEAAITGHTTIARLLMEIAPVAPVHTITVTEETGDITIMEVAMGNTVKAAEVMATTGLHTVIITALRMGIRGITTAPMSNVTNVTNVLTTGHASRDMTIDRPKLIRPLLREMPCREGEKA
jgi:hypothetical protein